MAFIASITINPTKNGFNAIVLIKQYHCDLSCDCTQNNCSYKCWIAYKKYTKAVSHTQWKKISWKKPGEMRTIEHNMECIKRMTWLKCCEFSMRERNNKSVGIFKHKHAPNIKRTVPFLRINRHYSIVCVMRHTNVIQHQMNQNKMKTKLKQRWSLWRK